MKGLVSTIDILPHLSRFSGQPGEKYDDPLETQD